MSKSSLRILAVLLTVGIIVVLFAGLDSLPGAVKAQIAAEHKSFSAAESQVQAAAGGDAESVRQDAAHWVDLKQHLPREVRDMERDYQAIHAVDLAATAAAAQKAEADWPQKKNDLESRLATARGIQ